LKFNNLAVTDWNANNNHVGIYKEAILNITNLREEEIISVVANDATVC
jgi:hypothetical protein